MLKWPPKKITHIASSIFLCTVTGLYPLISLWRNNLEQIPNSAIPYNLLISILLILAVMFFWRVITRSLYKSTLLSCTTLMFIFSFGHLYNIIGKSVIIGISIGIIKFFLIWLIILVVSVFLILKTIKQEISLYLFILPASFLLMINLVPIIRFQIINKQYPSSQETSVQTNKLLSQDLPDIYYIILDAYARNDVLNEVIGYDNTGFLSELEKRGFYLPECSFSNYDGTVATLVSVLNYNSLNSLGIRKDSQGTYQVTDFNLIHNNLARNTFRSLGYEFVTGRGYASFNDIRSSDIYLNYAIDSGIADNLAQERFTSLYLNTTIFRILSELFKNNPEKFSHIPFWLSIDRESDPSLVEANFWYMQNNFMFDKLEEFPDKTGNYFIYAHINAPHGPYVYRQDGSFRYPIDDKDEKDRYNETVIYINKRIIEVIDVLQAKSQPSPIIIIQGDHGIHKMTSGLDKHKILNAYYLPGEIQISPYDTITPINNFRLILHNYFDPTIDLLPDLLWVKFTNNYENVLSSCSLKSR